MASYWLLHSEHTGFSANWPAPSYAVSCTCGTSNSIISTTSKLSNLYVYVRSPTSMTFKACATEDMIAAGDMEPLFIGERGKASVADEPILANISILKHYLKFRTIFHTMLAATYAGTEYCQLSKASQLRAAADKQGSEKGRVKSSS